MHQASLSVLHMEQAAATAGHRHAPCAIVTLFVCRHQTCQQASATPEEPAWAGAGGEWHM